MKGWRSIDAKANIGLTRRRSRCHKNTTYPYIYEINIDKQLTMHVIFNHGKESGPWGTKIKALAKAAENLACSVDSLDFNGEMDADKRVTQLLAAIDQCQQPPLLVGSSMGGYVATVAASQRPCAGLFVLAPAYYLGGAANFDQLQISCPMAIVHGWQDDIVPVANSWRVAQRLAADLHVVNDDHRLIKTLDHTVDLFTRFLTKDLA